MKHLEHIRKQTGKCYFEDVTIFLCETEEEYNATKEKYYNKRNETLGAITPTFQDKVNVEYQGGEFEGFSFTEYGYTIRQTRVYVK